MYIITATAETPAIAFTVEDAIEHIHYTLEVKWEADSWYYDRSHIEGRIKEAEAEAEDGGYALWLVGGLELRCYVNPVIVKKFGA